MKGTNKKYHIYTFERKKIFMFLKFYTRANLDWAAAAAAKNPGKCPAAAAAA